MTRQPRACRAPILPPAILASLVLALLGGIASPASATTAPSFSVSNVSCIEGQACVFTIRKSAKAASYSKITFTTHGGASAAYGVDFQPVTVTLTFANNQLSQTVSVPTLQDSADESAEQFTVQLTAVRFASIGNGSTAAGTIVDDDAAPPQPATRTCPDGSVIPADQTCPPPPPPPLPSLPPGKALALSACPALNRPESIVAGQLYDVVGFGGFTQPGGAPPPPGTQEFVILSDATHSGDGWFALYVPTGCVQLG